jgi:methylphosphotriester-DNA--protein-cysteine methyltransferase
MLDVEECERARISRNPAYDGRFFTGVRTTRIYCRPVCPVRPARANNACFYPSAAAAEAAYRAGFGSLRRFNAVFAEVYRRPPTKIRRNREFPPRPIVDTLVSNTIPTGEI